MLPAKTTRHSTRTISTSIFGLAWNYDMRERAAWQGKARQGKYHSKGSQSSEDGWKGAKEKFVIHTYRMRLELLVFFRSPKLLGSIRENELGYKRVKRVRLRDTRVYVPQAARQYQRTAGKYCTVNSFARNVLKKRRSFGRLPFTHPSGR